jgi:predicted HTH domain antitoxin
MSRGHIRYDFRRSVLAWWYLNDMQFTVELPDDLAQHVIPAGHDPSRTALEDMAVEAYRAHRLTEYQLANLLGMGRYELDGFLKQREVWLEYTVEDLQRELDVHKQLGL